MLPFNNRADFLENDGILLSTEMCEDRGLNFSRVAWRLEWLGYLYCENSVEGEINNVFL